MLATSITENLKRIFVTHSVSDKYSLKKFRDKQRGNERQTRTTTTKTKAQGSRKERKGTKNKPKLKVNGYKICKVLRLTTADH